MRDKNLEFRRDILREERSQVYTEESSCMGGMLLQLRTYANTLLHCNHRNKSTPRHAFSPPSSTLDTYRTRMEISRREHRTFRT